MNIRNALLKSVDKEYKISCQRYFKEKINILGVRTPVVRKISSQYFPKEASKEEVFKSAEKLIASKYGEESLIGMDWAYKLRKSFLMTDFALFESWLTKYVSNWGQVDEFCSHALGSLILKYPTLTSKTKIWVKSPNRWLRRAAAVCLIAPNRKIDLMDDVYWVAKQLLQDDDDLVQKAYGWMLKEACKRDEPGVFAFVMQHKDKMPRTALRYAIEKMPKDMKKKAMERNA